MQNILQTTIIKWCIPKESPRNSKHEGTPEHTYRIDSEIEKAKMYFNAFITSILCIHYTTDGDWVSADIYEPIVPSPVHLPPHLLRIQI
jgi:hypothetical protein